MLIGLLYLILINCITYFAFWVDKQRAVQQRYRIPEKDLLFLALIGGSPAAILARQFLRHKTRKQPFGTVLLCIPGFQIGLAVAIVAWAI